VDSLSPQDFERLGAIIQQYSGILMPASKRTMVEGRLRRRIRALNLSNMEEYCRHVLDKGGLKDELVNLIDVVTTNKTEFFREMKQFRFLKDQGIDALMQLPHRPGSDRPMKLWSAACSSGAEPYTLAMVLHDFALTHRPFRFEIVATDISTDVLARAKLAVYPEEMAAAVPPDLARRYLLRSRDRRAPTLRPVPQIRQSVRFGRLNLMDADYPLPQDMDAIFCRNILIYFDKETQASVLGKLCRHLRVGGLLFIGHSEAVSHLNLPLVRLATAIFRRS
jgi:chemotaxis protein methyltransferase CheR